MLLLLSLCFRFSVGPQNWFVLFFLNDVICEEMAHVGQDKEGTDMWKTAECARREGAEQDLENGQFVFEHISAASKARQTF